LPAGGNCYTAGLSPLAFKMDTVTLELNHGELSALSYLVAFAVLNHPKLTPHEDSLVTKISQLDPDGYKLWQEAVRKTSRVTATETRESN
jgi:hypothetical protein